MSQVLKDAVLEIKAIGQQIAELSKRSKDLRATVATEVATAGIGEVNDHEPVEFLIDNLNVSVVRAKDGKDYTVTFKELKSI